MWRQEIASLMTIVSLVLVRIPLVAQEQDPKWSADSPQWRGPNRDGVVHGVTVPKTWPKTLTVEWEVPVGEGVSSPVVVGGKVFLHTRQKSDEEVVLGLDLISGKEKWR